MDRDPRGRAAMGLREYVCRVVALLGDDDVWAVDCDVELPPAMAMIITRTHVPTMPHRELVLTWDEVDGWATRITLDAEGETTALAYLGGDLLAAPEEVASFLRDSVAGHHPGTPFPPCFRGLEADDDLDVRLAHFS